MTIYSKIYFSEQEFDSEFDVMEIDLTPQNSEDEGDFFPALNAGDNFRDELECDSDDCDDSELTASTLVIDLVTTWWCGRRKIRKILQQKNSVNS